MPLRFGEVQLLGQRPRRDPSPFSIRVIQPEYGHEVAVVKYRYDAKFLAYLTRGAPLSIVWGRDVNTARLDGYVHHVVVDQRSLENTATMTVVCVGATDPLNQPDRNSFHEAHVDGVVSELARRNGFSVLIERHGFVWPVLQQQGESTWAFLVSSAKRIGYTLYARNTDLRCHSRAIRTDGAQTFRSDLPAPQQVASGALLAFNIVQAETLAGEARKRDRVLTGVDQVGNPYIAQTSAPTDVLGALVATRLVQYNETPAQSVAEANALAKGAQELNRHYLRAKASVSGNVRVHAAGSVRLLGLNADQRGFWFVERAEHMISATDYQVSLVLGKDSLGDPLGAPPPVTWRVPGDTSRRAVVHDGRRAVTTGGQDAFAPVAVYVDPATVIPVIPLTVSGRWRSAAPIERELPAVRRRVREVTR